MFHLRSCFGAAFIAGLITVSNVVPVMAQDKEIFDPRFHFRKNYYAVEQDRIPPALLRAASRPAPHTVTAGEVSLPPNSDLEEMLRKPPAPPQMVPTASRFGAPRQVPPLSALTGTPAPLAVNPQPIAAFVASKAPLSARKQPTRSICTARGKLQPPATVAAIPLSYKPGFGYQQSLPEPLSENVQTNCRGRLLLRGASASSRLLKRDSGS